MFGGVYWWSAVILAAGITILFIAVRPRLEARGPLRTLDVALTGLLAAALFQLVPLPAAAVRILSPGRDALMTATSLQPPEAAFTPLTIDVPATAHAWLALFCVVATFWTARALFARGGIRTFSNVIAWGAIAMTIVAFAQHASGTEFVYGFWHPSHIGARPLGPFINRNHLGTWSILAICLCAGYLQWRGEGGRSAASWRTRVFQSLDARRLVLQLAVVLLASVVALGASRSSLVALGCAAGYVAVAGYRAGRGRFPLAVLAVCALGAMLGYGDGQRLLLRVDETRTVGMANRVAIWRDTVPVIRGFPVTGVGAGAFGSAMRVYQTGPRTYHYNETHNQYLQLAAEGGLLLGIPAVIALGAFIRSAWRQLRHRDDPVRWMRLAASGALIGVAVQSIWETGLTLPANGMFAAALAGLLVHGSTPNSQIPTPKAIGSNQLGER